MAAPSSSTRRLASSELVDERGRSLFELGAGLFQARHLDRQRTGSLHERGVRRACFGRALAQVLGGLSCFEQPALCHGQPLVGLALRALQPSDRRARLGLPAIERVSLLFRLVLLARQLLGLLREARLLVGRVLELRVESDNGLVLLVVLGVQCGDRIGGMSDGRLELRGLLREPHQRLAVGGDAFAQLLDFALGLEDAARFGAPAARHEVRAAEHVSVQRRNRQRREPAGRCGSVVRSSAITRFSDGLPNRRRKRPVDPNDRGQRDDARRAGIGWVASRGATYETSPVTLIDAWNDRAANGGRRRFGHEKAAAAGTGFPDQLEAGGRMLRPFDDHVLEQIAEAGFHRALVPVLNLEVVGDRALLIDLAVGLDEHGPRGVAVARARGVELLERREAGLETGELVLAGADRSRSPFVLDARARQLGLARRARDPRRFDRVVRPSKAVAGRRAFRADPFGLDPDVARFDVELRQRFADAIARGRRVLERVPQRRRRVERREHLSAGRFDVGFQPFELAMRVLVGVRFGRQRRRGAVAIHVGFGGGVAASRERHARRLAPGFEALEFGGDVRRARRRASAPARDRRPSAARGA